jgi:hypothetical protein
MRALLTEGLAVCENTQLTPCAHRRFVNQSPARVAIKGLSKAGGEMFREIGTPSSSAGLPPFNLIRSDSDPLPTRVAWPHAPLSHGASPYIWLIFAEGPSFGNPSILAHFFFYPLSRCALLFPSLSLFSR